MKEPMTKEDKKKYAEYLKKEGLVSKEPAKKKTKKK